MQVKDLTTSELKNLIRETVVQVFGDLLPDPDEGMTVKEEFKQELFEIQRRRKTGTRGISSEEVMNRLGGVADLRYEIWIFRTIFRYLERFLHPLNQQRLPQSAFKPTALAKSIAARLRYGR